MPSILAYGAVEQGSAVSALNIERRETGPCDVKIQILFCGICGSDLHAIRNDWKDTTYPLVPGHEIVGKITELGSQAFLHFKVGDKVAVGCMVDSCRECSDCKEGFEQYCQAGTYTYNSFDQHLNQMTFGGFSESIVVDQKFVFKIPDNLDLAGAAPLLCAGITPYSALRHWNIGKGSKVGVVGLGGLGHMGVKLAAALGADVTLFTTSPDKIEEGKRLGATRVVLSTDAEQMKECANSLDLILNTASAQVKLDNYVALLKREGTLCLLGVPAIQEEPVTTADLIFRRRHISGSMIGGPKETQELLDFCAEHQITADVELIGSTAEEINNALDRLRKGDVKYRFVIRMG